jgi:hypothetical protein
MCLETLQATMKKTESEQEIHARLRQLADEARRLRDELAANTRQRVVGSAGRPIRASGPGAVGKKKGLKP